MDFGSPTGARIEAINRDPTITAQTFWDAWPQDGHWETVAGGASVYTTAKERCQPPYWLGDAGTIGGGNYSLYTTDAINHPVDTAAIVASRLADMRGTIDVAAYLIYSDTEIDGVTPPVAEAAINATYYAHRAYSLKDYVKRSVILNVFAFTSANQAGWTSWVINEMNDRNWASIQRGGESRRRKIIYVFDPVGTNADATQKANWLAMKAAIEAVHGPLFAVGLGTISTSAWTGLGLVGGTSYDGGLGASPGANGQHSSADQATKDQSNTGQSGFAVITTVNFWNDGRPRRGEAGVAWSDTPAIPDALDRFAYGLQPIIEMMMLNSGSEIGECGPGEGSLQDGRTRTGKDQIDWLRGKTRPSTYTYTIPWYSLYCAATVGTWPRTNSVAGAYDSQARRSSTTSDIFSLTCDGHILAAKASCTVEPLVEKGPDRGVCEILVDGVSQGTVDLYAASASENNALGSYTVAAGKRIDVRVNGTKNASSSGFTCGGSAWRITYDPRT